MGVQVDEAWQHEFTGCVDRLLGPIHRQTRREGSDPSMTDTDVALPAQGLARIDHLTAPYEEVEGAARVRLRPGPGRGGETRRGRTSEPGATGYRVHVVNPRIRLQGRARAGRDSQWRSRGANGAWHHDIVSTP
jgi:hypothetical protein